MMERNGEWEQDSTNGGWGEQHFSEHIFWYSSLKTTVMFHIHKHKQLKPTRMWGDSKWNTNTKDCTSCVLNCTTTPKGVGKKITQLSNFVEQYLAWLL